MSIQIYVTSVSPEEAGAVQVDDEEILAMLGPQEEAVAVQLQELFSSITGAITASLEVESQLNIEISGSVSLKVQGGLKYLFFNIGGEAGASGAMKVSLSTTLRPKAELKISKGSENGG